VGNTELIDDISTTSQPPFLLGILPSLQASGGFTSSTEPSHVVSLYHGVEDVKDTLIIQDRTGKDEKFTGVDIVKIPKEGGGTATFSKGEAIGKTVGLDFSNGDVVVTPDTNQLFNRVTIPKPSSLAAENIRENVNVAGVTGTLVDHRQEELNVELDFSDGDMVFTPEAKALFSKVGITRPETLVPANIAEGVEIAGVLGELKAGGGGVSKLYVKTGIFTGTAAAQTITHGCNVVPLWIKVEAAASLTSSSHGSYKVKFMDGASPDGKAIMTSYGNCMTTSGSFGYGYYDFTQDAPADEGGLRGLIRNVNSSTFKVGGGSRITLATTTYFYIAIYTK
jgi:hypothetical protein